MLWVRCIIDPIFDVDSVDADGVVERARSQLDDIAIRLLCRFRLTFDRPER